MARCQRSLLLWFCGSGADGLSGALRGRPQGNLQPASRAEVGAAGPKGRTSAHTPRGVVRVEVANTDYAAGTEDFGASIGRPRRDRLSQRGQARCTRQARRSSYMGQWRTDGPIIPVHDGRMREGRSFWVQMLGINGHMNITSVEGATSRKIAANILSRLSGKFPLPGGIGKQYDDLEMPATVQTERYHR
jgi:hypothetical protein